MNAKRIMRILLYMMGVILSVLFSSICFSLIILSIYEQVLVCSFLGVLFAVCAFVFVYMIGQTIDKRNHYEKPYDIIRKN